MMNTRKQADLIFGDKNENIARQVICDNFGITSASLIFPQGNSNLKKLDTYNHMDFESDLCLFEIKSRRVNHNSYKTTMVGFDKITVARNSNKDVYFIFMFNDGNYFYKFNNNDNFYTSIGGRCDRGRDEKKLYYFIPVSCLKKMVV